MMAKERTAEQRARRREYAREARRRQSPPIIQADKTIQRRYFLAAWKHIAHILPEMGQKLLQVAERDLFGDAEPKLVRNAEAIVMAEILAAIGVRRVDWREDPIQDTELRHRVRARGRLVHQLLLSTLTTLRGGDLSRIQQGRYQTAYLLGRYWKQNSHPDWRKVMGAEVTWLSKLRDHIWPPLVQSMPGMIDRTTYQLAVSLAKGDDCAFALHDALQESPGAGNKRYLPTAIKHFNKSSYHPLGCKYLDCLLDKSNVAQSTVGRPILVVQEPYDLVDEAGNVVGRSDDLSNLIEHHDE